MEPKTLAQAQRDLSELVEQVIAEHVDVEITRDGKRAAILVSADKYAPLRETLAVLADHELVRAIGETLADASAGNLASHDEVIQDPHPTPSGDDPALHHECLRP